MKIQLSERGSGGFTLVELIISASLMVIILTGAYLCLSSGLSSEKLIQSRAEIVQGARVALAILGANLRCACPLSKERQFLGMDRMLGEIEADNLDFATHNLTPRRAGEGDFCEVSYFLDKDAESGQFSLWRRRDSAPDEELLSGGSREEIARGIRGIKFEYYDGYDWYDEWGDLEGRGKADDSLRYQPNLSGIPEAVRTTLWFDLSSQRSQKTSAEKENPEPPMVFQTVTRLNLAGVSLRDSPASSSTGAGNARTQPGVAQPESGNPP